MAKRRPFGPQVAKLVLELVKQAELGITSRPSCFEVPKNGWFQKKKTPSLPMKKSANQKWKTS